MSKKHGPWVIKKRTKIYQNPWMQVYEDRVIRPDKKSGIFGFINLGKGVSVLPLDKNGNVYLVYQFHYGFKKNVLSVVSGGINKNEKLLTAAKRELKEELGIVAKDWIKIGYFCPFTTIINFSSYLYLVQDLKFKNSNPEGTEIIKIKKIKLEKALEMVMNNKIQGVSSVLILKTKEYLKN
ncbi:MAG: NUDIX hydrolase [Patescibacteria group bacterium]